MASEHATTGDAINHAIDKASAGLDQIAHALSFAAPQAWALACKGVFAQGAASLAVGVIMLLAAIPAFVAAVYCFKRIDWSNSDFPPLIIPGLLAALVVLFCGVGGFVHLADSDAWVRIISPDGFLAQQILSKALN